MKKLVKVTSSPLARNVGVVCGRYKTDSFRSTGEHVADSVGEELDLVGTKLNIVMDEIVMRWASGALETTMGYVEL